AAPSPTTCWIVGRGGVVLLTTDGQKWESLRFPDPTDLSAVRATDARTATVTTIDGREYSTTDGGNTWIRR
ncbi:MAG TPA: YCF48-related protein, partial [Vicinamibacterales bacterium]|nr:YCF48-related protein [Vicinamibacterales bacterium]